MKNIQTTSLRVHNNQLSILDQQALPQQENWLTAHTTDQLVDHILALRVRGAPLIGLSACLLLALQAEQGLPRSQLEHSAQVLLASRPTAVNLQNNLQQMADALQQSDFITAMVERAESLLDEDRQLCENIASAGTQLVKTHSKILTHCNTGGLATAGIGTALGVIQRAYQGGKIQHVWVDETRPLLQGGRLTAWELEKLAIPYRLITDSMAAGLMAQGEVDAIWVGADRIAANGDVANKIGTYSLAALACFHQIPFYVAAPQTTIDSHCLNGTAIPIEQRAAQEVLGVQGCYGQVQWAPQQAKVYNPAFDVTPAKLISGWVLDNGIVMPEQVEAGYFSNHESA